MRILIAEDELLERKAMKMFIANNFNDMVIVGEAINGRTAIQLAASTNPDIILMDIKMPGINGLEAIKKIKEADPTIKFILVSAYDSFDYAKEAMQYGIKDYILKPGKKEEIVTSIRRLQKEINIANHEKHQTTALLKDRFITKAMQQPIADDFNDLKQTLFPTMKSICFLAIKSDKPLDLEITNHIIHQDYIVKEHSDTITICITSSLKLKKSYMLKIAQTLQIALGESTYIGVGYPAQSIHKSSKSYHEAYLACLQLAGTTKRRVGFYQERTNTHTSVMSELAFFVEKGLDEEATQLFEKHADTLTETEKEHIYMMVKEMHAFHEINPMEPSIKSLQTNQDWSDFLRLSCINIKAFYQSKNHINQAKGYIHAHFHEVITLEDVAMNVHLSPNYFSNLFKQELGMTFIDYLTEVRLHKAKEYMQENAFSLKEISYMVGYNDPNYFSRVFKKQYRESPKRFQQAIFKK